jgi:hypothetical protein
VAGPRSEHVAGSGDAWYRQGIVWLAAAIFAASIAGCLWLLVVGQRYVDPPLPQAGPELLKMPVAPAPAPAATEAPT